MRIPIFIFSVLISCKILSQSLQIPIQAKNRQDIHAIELTSIGEFGILRKERPGIPAHLHTGIDIKRPTSNYKNEPIFPICEGIVISKRTDGPYAQLIIEHRSSPQGKFWSVYEHIAGIHVELGDLVDSETPIARFMNLEELNTYGWQFDHFHFEILKIPPLKVQDERNQDRHFSSYSLTCFTVQDLRRYYFDPKEFFSTRY